MSHHEEWLAAAGTAETGCAMAANGNACGKNSVASRSSTRAGSRLAINATGSSHHTA